MLARDGEGNVLDLLEYHTLDGDFGSIYYGPWLKSCYTTFMNLLRV